MAENERDPRILALARLTVREYSAQELKAYLRRKGVDRKDADLVVDQLVSEELVSDSRYSRVVARHQAMRDKGPGYIRAQLQQKGVRLDASEARRLYAETSPHDEMEQVLEILRRRYPRAQESQKERQRAYQGLIRRGFSVDVVLRCIHPKVAL